jgi:crotonobetainyl-CoA:carnitine CoA-transferase CaiB-like acyl-CoA transferase
MTILNPYKVLDLTDEKGWFCPKLLFDLGAEVVRIQKPGEPVVSVYANTGKHGISLNLETAMGTALFLRLVKEFDVVIESFAPGFLASLGLSFTNLNQVNQRLIMASITYFGQSGPYLNKKSSELVSSALGGQAFVSGDPGKPPLKPFGPQAYNTAGLFAANGILLALLQRHSSGKGQYLDISIHESVAATLDHVMVNYFYGKTIKERTGSLLWNKDFPGRTGALHWNKAFPERTGALYWNKAFRIFACRDGYIVLSFLQNFDTLVELLDAEGMAGDLKDAKWHDLSERWKNSGHIIEILEKWTQIHTADKLMELGQLMRFPWAKVASIPEVVQSPQLNAREYFIEARDPQSGRGYKFPGAPVKMSGSPWRVNSQVPRLGEYNEEIYQRRLGLTPAEMKRLEAEGVI